MLQDVYVLQNVYVLQVKRCIDGCTMEEKFNRKADIKSVDILYFTHEYTKLYHESQLWGCGEWPMK